MTDPTLTQLTHRLLLMACEALTARPVRSRADAQTLVAAVRRLNALDAEPQE